MTKLDPTVRGHREFVFDATRWLASEGATLAEITANSELWLRMMEQDELTLDVLEAANATGDIGYALRALYADRPREEWFIPLQSIAPDPESLFRRL